MSADVVIEYIQQRDEKAFQTLVRQYHKSVLALAYHYVRNTQDAQEVAQDVFVKVYQRVESLENPRCFAGWLRRIVYTEAMMLLRTRRRSIPIYALDTDNSELAHRDMQQYEDSQYRTSVMEALQSLPEDECLLVELRYLGEMTSREIGKLLGMKPGTVRYRLHRAIQSLKEVFSMEEKQLQEFAEQIWKSLGRIQGRVIGMDGKPLGNISLDLDERFPEGDFYGSNHVKVAADGTFKLDLPNWNGFRTDDSTKGGEFTVGLYGRIDGAIYHAATSARIIFGEEADDVVLDLRQGTHPLRIRVLDPAGAPVKRARLYCRRHGIELFHSRVERVPYNKE